MIAAGPSHGDRPLPREGVCEVREANEPGGGIAPIAAGPSQGDRPLPREGVCEVREANEPGGGCAPGRSERRSVRGDIRAVMRESTGEAVSVTVPGRGSR